PPPGARDRWADRAGRGRCHRELRSVLPPRRSSGTRRRAPAPPRTVPSRRPRSDEPAGQRGGSMSDGAFLGLIAGLGRLAIWWSLWGQDGQERQRGRLSDRMDRLRDELVQGALPTVTSGGVAGLRAGLRRAEAAALRPGPADHLNSAIRAGLSLPEALVPLGRKGPEELQPAFVEFARDYQASGDFSACLDRLKVRLADPVGDRIVEALRLTRDVGGT